MRDLPVFPQRQQRGERGEHGIAVIGAAAAIEFVVLDDRRPRARALGPALHFRLLVEMAVEQNRSRRFPGNLHEDQRRAAGKADDFQLRAGQVFQLPARPGFEQRDRLGPCGPCFSHSGSKTGDLVRDADIFGQRGQNLVVPDALDEGRHGHARMLAIERADYSAAITAAL